MSKLDASAVARLLVEYSQRMALRGGNPYRAKAYHKAAESLLALTVPLEAIVAQGRLRDIPGIGPGIEAIVRELHRTGTHPSLETMRAEIPESVLDIMSVPGLRPDKVLKLYRELGIANLEELERAARDGRVRRTKGLGSAIERKILQGIELKSAGIGQRHIHRAGQLLAEVEKNLRTSSPMVQRITAAGEFRRGCELVADLGVVAEMPNHEGTAELRSADGLKIWFTNKPRYGSTLLLATGSAAHVRELQTLAEQQGGRLDIDGLRRGDKIIAAKTEEAIYAALGLPFIEPELREGRGEIALAIDQRLPVLVRDEDIRGILHAHTDASDGVHGLEDMAEATRKLGYYYFGVADHSRSAAYAGGLSIEAIEAQHAAIDRLNAGYAGAFRIFKGIESDILLDGSLDYPDETLERFDFVVASVHSRFGLDRETQTARIVRAVANPYTTILGHMTGRQLLRRPPYAIDIDQVLTACAAHGVSIEINGNPWRLDLDWRWHPRALQLGCMLSINPDAHAIAELALTHWGVEMARKGGVPKQRILNCLPLRTVERLFNRRKPSHSPAKPRRERRGATVTVPGQ